MSTVQNVISTNLNFEKKANELSAITGIIGKDLDTLKQKALETSSVTRFSADQILEGFKLIANAKPELAGSVDSLNAVKDAAVQLAQASSSDLPTAVNGLLFTLNQFGAGADQAGKFVDALAAGAKFGAAEIPAISEAIKEFGTQAATSNVSIYESVGLVELLASKGIQSAEAGTKLRNVLLALDAAPALGRRALKELNKAGVDLKILGDNTLPLEQRLTELAKVQDNNTALVKVFGKENFNAGQIVLKNIPAFVAFEKQVRSTGVAQEQAAINSETASVKIAKLGNQLKNAFTSDAIVKVLGAVASSLSFVLKLITAIPFGLFIAGISLATAAWAFYKGNVISATLAQSWNNEATLLGTVRRASDRLALLGSAAAASTAAGAETELAVATTEAAVATETLNVATKFSPLGLILGVIALIIPVMSAFGSTTEKTADSFTGLNTVLKSHEQINSELQSAIQKDTGKTKNSIDELISIIKTENGNLSLRQKAYEALIKIAPDFTGTLDAEFKATNKLNEVYNKYIEQLDKVARAKAITNIKQQREDERAKKESEEFDAKLKADQEAKDNAAIEKKNNDARNFNADPNNRAIGGAASFATPGQDIKKIEKLQNEKAEDYKKAKAAAEKARNEAKAFDEFMKTANDVDKAALIDGIKSNTVATPPTPPTPPTGDPKGKTSEQIRDERIKIQDDLFNIDKNNLQRKNLTEVQYATELNKLVQKYSDAKLQILNESADKEQLRISELNLDKFNSTKDTNEKLLALETNQAEKQLQLKKEAAQSKFDFVNGNPNSTNKQKYDAKINMDIALVQAQFKFNTDIDNIEKTYGKKSVENEKAREKTFQELFFTWAKDTVAGTKESYDEQLRLADEATRTQANIIKQNAASKTIDVLNNNSLGPNDKAKSLKQIEAEETRNLLKAEIEDAKESLKIKQKGLATEIEISDAKTKLKLAELALSKHVSESEQTYFEKFVGKLKGAYKNITDVFKGIKASQEDIDAAVGAAVQSISAAIEQSKQNFFNNQRANADAEKEATLARLDLQQQQLESTAQSENEKESIRRQFEEKRKQAEKKAGEEKKKVAQTELAINFAVAVVKTLAAYPFPFSLLPIAGLTLLYAAQKAQLNSQKFASGGYTGMGTVKDSTGHRVAGIVHNDEWVSPKWMVEHPTYGRVINQLENVRMKGFADGGFTGLGNLKLGDNLHAPVNTASFLNQNSKDQINKLTQLVNITNDNVNKVTDTVNNVSKRIDNIKVSVVAKEVDNQNTIDKKAIAKGRI